MTEAPAGPFAIVLLKFEIVKVHTALLLSTTEPRESQVIRWRYDIRAAPKLRSAKGYLTQSLQIAA